MVVDPGSMPSPLLAQAARTAGLFQRSALGHLEHPDWHSRFEADGKALAEALGALGFVANVQGSRETGNSDDRQ